MYKNIYKNKLNYINLNKDAYKHKGNHMEK